MTELDSKPIKIPSVMTEQRLEKCLDQYYFSIDKALKKACPLGKSKERNINNPWWTHQLQQQRTELNKLYRARKRGDSEWETFKEAEKRYKIACRKAKKKDWMGFVEGQQTMESINKLCKILEANKKHMLGVMKRDDGSHTEPGCDTLQYLLKAHFPSMKNTKNTVYTEDRVETHKINKLDVAWITKDKVKEVLKIFKNKKSPGPDGLQPIVLKQLSDGKIEELIFLYKTTLVLEFTPLNGKNPISSGFLNPTKIDMIIINLGGQSRLATT